MWLSLGGGDLQPSMVECEQVRVIDVTDDWKYLCTLPVEIMRRVDTALRNAFFYGGV
jgi:mRNA-degrading endonuclease toxin of MazEF toxin-antitoxin module